MHGKTHHRHHPVPHSAPHALRLPWHLRGRLDDWVTAGYPEETCGLLLGRMEGRTTWVTDLALARNLNRARAGDRYELDPGDYAAADLAARARGLEVVGVWHSHPDHPARPSLTDRAAAWGGWSYLIAAVTRAGVRDLRSWRLEGDRFVEEVIES